MRPSAAGEAVTRTSGRRERSSAARHFRQIIERAPIAIVVHREGRILYANAVCRQYLGIQRVEEVAGTDPLALVPVDERSRFRERLARIQAGGSGGPTQTEFVRADGTTMPIEVAVAGLKVVPTAYGLLRVKTLVPMHHAMT